MNHFKARFIAIHGFFKKSTSPGCLLRRLCFWVFSIAMILIFQTHIVFAATAFVQKKNTSSQGSALVAVTFDSTPTSGNLLIAIVANRVSSTPTTPAGWSVAISTTAVSPGQVIYYKTAGASEASTVTVTGYATTNQRLGIQVFEYSGVDTLDQTNQNSGNGTSLSTGSITTTVADELLIAGVATVSSTNFSTWSNSFTEQHDYVIGGFGTQVTAGGADRIVASTGSYSTTATSGNSGNWRAQIASFSASSTIDISGTCKQLNQSTDCTNTGTVRVAVNGTLQAQTQPTVGGTWTISGVTAPSSGAVITVFIDAAGEANEAVAVAKYDGTGNITGIELIEEHLTVGSDDNQILTNTDLSQYDNSISIDEDVFHEVNGANDLTVDFTAQFSAEKLYIKTGNTYRPDSASSGDVSTHDIEINGTLTADGNTLTVGGDWDMTTGTFNYDTSTVDFTGTGTISNDNVSWWLKEFYNVNAAVAGQSTTVLATRGIVVLNILTLGSGTLTGGEIVVSKGSGTPLVTSGATISNTIFKYYSNTPGSVNVTATIYPTLWIGSDSASTTFNLAGNIVCTNLWVFGNTSGNTSVLDTTTSNHTITCGLLNIGLSGATTQYGTLKLNNSTVDINGDATIYPSGAGTNSIDADTSTINVSGNWSNSDTFTADTSTVSFDGTAQSLTGDTTFYNLNKTVTAADTLTFTAGSITTIAALGTLTLDGDPGQRLSLRSGTPSTRWNLILNATANKAVDYVDVQDSDASGSDDSLIPILPTNTIDSGNTIAWFDRGTLIKRAFLSSDNSALADTTILPRGTLVKFLIYINNLGSIINDISVRDVLDAAFLYQGVTETGTSSLKINTATAGCALLTCTAGEEATIFSDVDATLVLDEVANFSDVVSFSGLTIDAGNQFTVNLQANAAANMVWALSFEVKIQ